MTPSPPPADVPGAIAVIATIVGGLVYGVYNAIKLIKAARQHSKPPEVPDLPEEPISETPTDANENQTLESAFESFKASVNERMDEFDARLDYTRQLAERTARAVATHQHLSPEDHESQDCENPQAGNDAGNVIP